MSNENPQIPENVSELLGGSINMKPLEIAINQWLAGDIGADELATAMDKYTQQRLEEILA